MKSLLLSAIILGALILMSMKPDPQKENIILRPEGQQTITASATVTSGVGRVMVGNGSLIASLTITFPANPNDRDNLLMLFNGGVTLLSLTGNILGTLPTSANTGVGLCYEYEATSGKWYRLY